MKNNEILLPHEAIGEEDDYRTFNLQRNVLCDTNFVALDFETATSSKNSVCEIGIVVVKNGILFEKTICFTGESPIGTRAEMRQIVIALGATPHSSVTQATDFLIVGSQVSEKISTKHQKALDMQVKGHSIQIIPIEKFMDMLRIYLASSQQ